MKKSTDTYEKKLMATFINILLSVFKWLCLIVCVINAGLTIGLLVMGLLKGENLASNLLAKMFDYLTIYTESETLTLIERVGKIKVLVAGVGYGFQASLTYGLIYSLVSKFSALFKSIIDGNMFTKENVKMINDVLPYTFITAFASPVIMYSIINSTDVFTLEHIEVPGIIYICIAYILKLIFEKGLDLEKKNVKYDKELSDFKARDGELKMSALKKEIEEKEKKSIKTTKVKKESPKKENKKSEKTTKKSEKGTTKKA